MSNKLTLEMIKGLPKEIFWPTLGWRNFEQIKGMVTGGFDDSDLSAVLRAHSPDWALWHHMTNKECAETIVRMKSDFPNHVNVVSILKSLKEDSEYVKQMIEESLNDTDTSVDFIINVDNLLEDIKYD